MKKLYSIPGLILGIAFIIASAMIITKSVEESEQFKVEKLEIAKILNFNDRLLSFRDWVFTEEAWQEKKLKFDHAVYQADLHYFNAQTYGNHLLFGCLGFLLVMILLYIKRIYFGLTMALSFIALAMLGQGIMSPILEMAAFKKDMTIKVYVKPKDIPYFEDIVAHMGKVSEIADYIRYVPVYGEDWADTAEELVGEGQGYLSENANTDLGFDKVFPGDTYFYYQNKGIMDVISLLWNNGNKPVAAAIGTFSVVVPSIKLFFTLFILVLPVQGLKRLRKFLGYIAKWSMADVFVVAAFLAYLSFANMSPGVEMNANVLFGLYYFGGYVLISIVLSALLDAAIREKSRIAAKSLEPVVNDVIEENSFEEKKGGDS